MNDRTRLIVLLTLLALVAGLLTLAVVSARSCEWYAYTPLTRACLDEFR